MWTLSLILVFTAVVVTKIIERIVKLRRKTIYPSEAVIDQVLPPYIAYFIIFYWLRDFCKILYGVLTKLNFTQEILEQIFLNAEYESLFNSSKVSKYWQYITSDEHFRNRYCTYDKSWRIDPHELLENWDYNRREFELQKLTWLDYPESYESKWKFEDQIMARKLGKKLVDVDFSSAMYIYSALDIPLRKDQMHLLDRWLVKFRVKTYSYFRDYWMFEPLSKNPHANQPLYFHVHREVIPKDFTYKYGRVCELIVDLKEFQMNSYKFDKIYQARYIDDKSWLGSLSLDLSLFNITAILAAPCLLHDYWKLNTTVHYWTNLVIATIPALFLLISQWFVLWRHFELYNTNIHDRPRRIIILLVSLIPIYLTVVLNLALEIGFLIGCVLGSAGYFFVVLDLYDKNYPYANVMAGISIALVTLIIDWKLLVSLIGSGKILTTLAHNIGVYVWFGILIALHNAFMLSIENLYFLKNLVRWNKTVVRDYALCFISVLVVTLFAPDTTVKVNL